MIRCVFHSSQHNPEANAAAAEFASQRIWGDNRGFSPHCSMTVIDGDTPIAAVIYHNADPDAGVIEMSAGAVDRRWMQPRVVWAMHQIPFEILGNQMCIHRVRGDNANVIAQHRKFGCSETVIPRGAGRDMDLHLFTFTDDAWRVHPIYRRYAR